MIYGPSSYDRGLPIFSGPNMHDPNLRRSEFTGPSLLGPVRDGPSLPDLPVYMIRNTCQNRYYV